MRRRRDISANRHANALRAQRERHLRAAGNIRPLFVVRDVLLRVRRARAIGMKGERTDVQSRIRQHRCAGDDLDATLACDSTNRRESRVVGQHGVRRRHIPIARKRQLREHHERGAFVSGANGNARMMPSVACNVVRFVRTQ